MSTETLNDKEVVLQHLKAQGPITDKQARDMYGMTRLGARIWDLKQEGHDIRKRIVKVPRRGGRTSRVAEYYLVTASRD